MPIKKGTLVTLHGKDFQRYISFFLGFCNVPNNFDYKREYSTLFNRYHPMIHEPKEGSIENTKLMVAHIFGNNIISYSGEDYSTYELGLDYLQILFCEPTQKLPVLILFSEHRNTGKSTLADYLREVLGRNVLQVSNKTFGSDFNESIADKILITCDETLLDRKAQAESIKDMSTKRKILVNPKGRTPYELDFHAKFIFTSNNSKMIYVDKNSERFWILEVPVLKSVDVNFFDKLKEEIPAFLYFLKNRKLHSKRESRMHFHKNLIKTNALNAAIEANEPNDAATIREALFELFQDERNGESIKLDRKTINKKIFGGKSNPKWIKQLIHDYLKADPPEKTSTTTVYFPSFQYDESTRGETQNWVPIKFNGRCYTFHKKDYVFDENNEPVIIDNGLTAKDEEMPF